MLKKTLFFIGFLLASIHGYCQNTYVPDDNFEQALIDLGYDSGPLDDFVPTANISGVSDLDILNKGISDLTGIEDFSALTQLDCSGNSLTNIDISKNSLLKIFWCFNNQLTSVDVTQNPDLISLRCEGNSLSDLDVTNNLNLNVLVCDDNQISILNLLNNTNLSRLQCGRNSIKNLNLQANNNLSYLGCEENLITSLNLIDKNRLEILICYGNEILELNLSNNFRLTDLDASNNQLCSLNLNNGNNSYVNSINFSGNTDLNCVVVDNPNQDKSSWQPTTFTNYVSRIEDCKDFILVDVLENFAGLSYTLPALTNGNYFTLPSGNGLALNAGDVISTSQTIYIYNDNGCFNNQSSFNVIIEEADYFIPKFFTPNGDGANDTWKIIDNANLVNNITIYDRYGKLLKFLPAYSSGWDGTYNGNLLPTDSYWYVIILNSHDVLKGYFTLKR